MNVGGIDSAKGGWTPAASNSNELKMIDNQIKDAQRKLKDVQNNEKLDDKMKSELITLYTKQITELQAQKQKLAAEQAQQRVERASDGGQKSAESSAQQEQLEEQGIIPIDEGLQRSIIRAEVAQESAKATSQVRIQKEGELRMASSDSYLREADPVATRQLANEVAAITAREIRALSGAAEDFATTGSGGVASKAKDADEPEGETETTGEVAAETAVAGSGSGFRETGQYLDDEA